MDGDFLLDTNVVIAFFLEEREVVERVLEETPIYLPSIVLGELFYGANRSHYVEQNTDKIYLLLEWASVLSCDANTASQFGIIKQQLVAKGRPIPDNDLWIAAIARQHGLTLVTRDEHFRAIENLRQESW